jgi:hypothetical protein
MTGMVVLFRSCIPTRPVQNYIPTSISPSIGGRSQPLEIEGLGPEYVEVLVVYSTVDLD